MDKTKFWIVGDIMFTSKIEAEYHYKRITEDCYCRKDRFFSCFSHQCCARVREIDLAAVIKDKKYIKFLDEKLIQLIESKNEKIVETSKIDKEIEDIKTEQSNLK